MGWEKNGKPEQSTTRMSGGQRAPVEVLLRGEASGGHLAVAEFALSPGSGGPPLHIHPKHGEGFYVIDGEITIRIGDVITKAGPGTFAFAAIGVPHTFANQGDAAARLLVVCTPAGFEEYFDRLATDYERGHWPSPARPQAMYSIAVGPSLR